LTNTIRKEKAVTALLVSILFVSLTLTAIPISYAQTTVLRCIPGQTDVYTAGTVVDVAVVIEDVTDLAGFDIKMTWNSTYLAYVDHTPTVTVEDYPSPISPSPYAGILHNPKLEVKNEVGANYYWGVYSTMGGPGFDGDGTCFVISLVVLSVPWDFEIAPDTFIDTLLHFEIHELADSVPDPITHDTTDGIVRLYAKAFEYPPEPLLKVTPETISGAGPCNNFEVDVMLMGDGHVDLDPFWDPAGFDMIMTFNNTHIEAVSVDVDPDGWFAAFWSEGIMVFRDDIDNTAGTVHVAFVGLGATHIPAYGQGRLFTVTFHELLETEDYPPPESEICLEGPTVLMEQKKLDAIDSLIPIGAPVSTLWHEITPNFCEGPYHIADWFDNTDGVLSECDYIILEELFGDGHYGLWHIEEVTVTLTLEQEPFPALDDWVWTASFGPDGLGNNGVPGRYVGDDDPYNGFGVPYWTGNFTTVYPFDSINQIDCTYMPFGPGEYTATLTENVDYKVHTAENLIELLIPTDTPIINEHWKDGVNNTLGGWPWIMYLASGIESVFVDMNNGTARYGINGGYAQPPPAEWWYDPDWPWELEGWWALGYFPGPWNWPPGSDWWLNYTAASYLTIDYNALPDPIPRFVDFNGTYADGLAALAAPVCTIWNEIYPDSTRGSYHIIDWIDSDMSGGITYCDFIVTESIEGIRTWHVIEVSTDITIRRKPWICDDHPMDPYYGWEPIVAVAGFPHPERELCPWHEAAYSIRLPHVVECATFKMKYSPAIGIDVWTQYPDPFGGQGPYEPSDMFWPQKEVILCAYVMYNHWPEQQKDVAFYVYDPQMELWGVFYNKTNEFGIACVRFRLPWPCYEWPDVIGVWCVTAMVDIACECYNDTVCFHYDYLANIIDVQTDKDSYAHCEHMNITVTFTSHSQMNRTITITVTVVDDSGVPFGYAAIDVIVYGAEYCTPKEYEVMVRLHVVKWARPKVGKIYVGALEWRGCPAGPLFEPIPTFTILAE
jgi:hypothetical protein